MEIVIAPIKIKHPSRIWNGWKDLLTELIKSHNITALGIDRDGEYYDEHIGVSVNKLFGKTILDEAISIIKGADLFIGGDTGLSHIAVFYGIKSIIIHQREDVFFRMSHLNFSNVRALFRPTPEQVLQIVNQ